MTFIKRQSGFTIVELLIVVVVIAILAAITIVAYNGIQNRAKHSATQSAVSQASKKIMTYAVTNAEQYPVNLAAVEMADSTVTYQYKVDNSVSPRTFCVTATNGTISYFQAHNVSSPKVGACDGHSSGGVATITNLIQNPSAETNTVSVSAAGGGVALSRDVSQAFSGLASIKVVSDGTVSGSGTQHLTMSSSYPAGVYRGAYYIKGTAGVSVYGVLRAVNGGVADTQTSPIILTGAWQRVEVPSMTITGSATTQFSLMARLNAAVATTFWVDGAILIEGSTMPAYADGNTAGWAWSGTTNNSTSTGMPQ